MKYSMRLAGALLIAFSASLALAQSGNSTISGSVKDASEAAIPEARVKITNVETGVQLDTVTNSAGLYRAGALVPGSYRIEADAVGFDHLTRGPLTLQVSQTLALDLTLQVGQQNATVNVVEAAPVTESQSSNIAQAVNRQMLAGLPLPNRAASSLAALAPGVVMIDSGSGTAENYPVFSVAGGRARNQNFTLDGGNVSNAVGLTRPQQLTSLPVDAMQEFRVIANNYSAEFGHSTGGVDHDVHPLRHQPVSRQPVRIAAEQRLQRAQLFRRDAAADPAQPVRRIVWRAHPQGQDLFFVTWERPGS